MFLEQIAYSSEHDDGEMRAFKAMERRSGRKNTTWRDDRDRIAPIESFSAVDVAVHRPSGLVALAAFAGTGTHVDPEEFAGGAFLWVLPAGQRQLLRVDMPRPDGDGFGTPRSVDIAPDGSTIAGLWSLGAAGVCCATVDVATVSLTDVSSIERPDGGNLFGSEELRFSPDGRWLLVTSAVGDGLVVIEVSGARAWFVPCAGATGAAWWPTRTDVLLVTRLSGTSTILASLNLSTGVIEDRGLLELPAGLREGDPWPAGVHALAVGQDGRSLVGLTAAAPEEAFAMPQRPRARLARGEVFSVPVAGVAGRISEVAAPFIDRYGASAVEHSRVRWLDILPADRIEIAPTCRTRLGAR